MRDVTIFVTLIKYRNYIMTDDSFLISRSFFQFLTFTSDITLDLLYRPMKLSWLIWLAPKTNVVSEIKNFNDYWSFQSKTLNMTQKDVTE